MFMKDAADSGAPVGGQGGGQPIVSLFMLSSMLHAMANLFHRTSVFLTGKVWELPLVARVVVSLL